MKKAGPLILLLQIAVLPCFGQVLINEVHPENPEWVELYNPSNNTINLSNWTIADTKQSDEITCYNIENCSLLTNSTYFLIIGRNTNISQITNQTTTYFYVDDMQIGNSLNKNGDTLVFCNSSYSTNFSYSDELDEDLSWQRISNDSWISFPPSPGKQNFYQEAKVELWKIETEDNIHTNDTTMVNVSILNRGMENATDLKINLSVIGHNLTYESPEQNLSPTSVTNISFNITFNESGNYTLSSVFENKTIAENISVVNPPPKTAMLRVALDDILIAGIEQSGLFRIDIDNKSGCDEMDNVSVSWFVSNASSQVAESRNFTVEVGCAKTAGTGSWRPEEEGNFTICGKITSSTATYNDTLVCKNVTVIPSPIESLETPDSATFGSLNFAKIKFHVSPSHAELLGLNNTDLRFVIYTPSGQGHYIIKDFDDESITSVKGCRSSFSLEIQNVSENFSAYIYLPFFITANCKDKIDNGDYLSIVRMFKLENGTCPERCSKTKKNCVNITEFTISVAGKNRDLCPETKVVYKSKKEDGNSEKSTSKKLEIEILSQNSSVPRNQEFNTTVSLKNPTSKKISFEIYSYIYSGSKCVSGGWTANKQEFSLERKEEKIIELTNIIKPETTPSEYSFRVRAKVNEKNIDADAKIIVTNETIPEVEVEKKEDTGAAQTSEPAPEPNLKIWNDTKLRINLTNCSGCKLLISTPNAALISSHKYRVFEGPGTYGVFVFRDGEILFNETFVWEEKTIPKTNEGLSNRTQTSATGEFTASQVGWSNAPKKFLNWLWQQMESSIESN